jgi:hypothetical protein
MFNSKFQSNRCLSVKNFFKLGILELSLKINVHVANVHSLIVPILKLQKC